jgi:hypothetical protein
MNDANEIDVIDEEKEKSQDLMDNDVPNKEEVSGLPFTMPATGTDAQYTTPQRVMTPLKIDNIPNDVFDKDVLGDSLLMSADSIPQAALLPKTQPKPGFWETAVHSALEMNTEFQVAKFGYNEFFKNNPLDDVIPDEGWTAMKPESVEGFDNKYWPYLTHSKSPNDLAARQQRIREQMAEDEKYANGSLFATLLGGGVGTLASLSTFLMPMAAGAKYIKVGQGAIKNMTRIAPGMAIDSVARNAMIQANRAGGNVQEAATGAFRDLVFGTALGGVGAALGVGKRAGELWHTRRALNFAADGVIINPVIKDGVVVKEMQASLAPGIVPTAQNAMYVGAANNYIEEVANIGLINRATKYILGNSLLGTPVMQASRSAYKEVSSFFNRIAFTGVITERTLQGETREFTAHEYATQYKDHARSVAGSVRDLYYQANGITGTSTGKALKNFKKTYSENRTITEEDFGKEIRSTLYTEGHEPSHPEVKEAAETIHKFFKGMGEDLFKSMGQEGTFLDPVTAWKYLPQNYNIPAMINRPGEWVDITIGEYQRQDALITALKRPAEETTARVNALEARSKEIFITDDASKKLYNETKRKLGKARRLREQQLDEEVSTIRNNPEYHILLEDRVMFDSGEVKELESILKPVNAAKEDVSKIKKEAKRYVPQRDKAEGKLISVEKELKKTKKAFQKSKDKTTDAFYEAKIAREEAEVADLREKSSVLSDRVWNAEDRLSKAESKLEAEKGKIQNDFHEGRIDKKFVKKEGFEDFELHSPTIRPKLRKVFENMAHMERTAKQVHSSITNSTPEDLLMGVFGHVHSNIDHPNAQHLKSRSHLVSAEAYNKTDFLDPDITKSVSAYASTMGRIIGFKRAFPEFADGLGLEGVLQGLHESHLVRLDNLTHKEGTKEGNKERAKIDKEYREAQKFMNATYHTYMGTYAKHDPKWAPKVQAMKNLVASAKLGAVPVYQIAELANILMKTSIMPFFSQGLKPLIKTLADRGKGPGSETFLDNAGNAHLALNHVRQGYASKLLNSDSQSYYSAGGAAGNLEALAGGASHMSGNLFGTNAIANANERIMSSAYQSEVMQAMYAHQDGTLTKNQRHKMLHYGLDVEKDSKIFIKNFERSEGWKEDRGYQSAYWTWKDSEASNKFAMSIRRATHDTVVNGNVFTSPYWAQNPLPGMIFMFHGWAYGALTHYTIPMMQRPTADMMIGVGLSVGLSMMAEPLLRMLNGKEPYEDDASWFAEAWKAIDYSGIMGPFAQYLQEANNATGGVLTPGLQTERMKNLSRWPGPIGGYMGDVVSVAQHGIKGDSTQGDLSRAARLLPFSSHLGLRYVISQLVKGSGLPEKRRDAEPYAWYDTKK